MNLLHIIAQITQEQVDIPRVELVNTSITKALQLVFGLAGAMAVIIVIIGGFNYTTSQGDPQKTSKAKNTILYALIGLVICISAFTIVSFVVGRTG